MLNGLLPCGVVYWAIAGSLLTFDPVSGGFYMFLFGIGTMPLLLSVVLLKNFVSKNHLSKLYRLIPAYQFALGVFLIWRAYRIDPSVLYLLSPMPMCH
jgi:sulfite exporter TauE/SafE